MKTYKELSEAKKRIPSNKVVVVADEDSISSMGIPQNMIAKILLREGYAFDGWDDPMIEKHLKFKFEDVNDYAKQMQKATPNAKKYAQFVEWEYIKHPYKGLGFPMWQADFDGTSAIKSGEFTDATGVKKNEMVVITDEEYNEL